MAPMTFDSTQTTTRKGVTAEDLQVVLSRHVDCRFCDLIVHTSEICITVSGTVKSYFLKQLAQEILRPHLRGRPLQNKIRVTS
ncbi:MAG: hypothetical protein R3B84_01950 [Zavarzinella sp.]